MNGGLKYALQTFYRKTSRIARVNITNIEVDEKTIIIHAEMEHKEHICKKCKTGTNKIHDYRTQVIKDIPAFGKLVSIVLRMRRYRCPYCGKRFFESNSFLPKYHRITNRLAAFVIDKLRDERSFTSVAKEVNLSVSTVIRIFDILSYPKAKLQEALSIDEFKGNTNGEKYQCTLTDPVNKVVLNILPERHGHHLTKYFKNIPLKERQQINVMLYYSANISRTYWYKEEFLKILTHKEPESARNALAEWVKNAEHCGILPFEKCAETIRNWYTGISNSFSTSITNGFTEGCNNKIKVLKRNAYGYKNFNRFRNRILHIFSHKHPNNEQAAA